MINDLYVGVIIKENGFFKDIQLTFISFFTDSAVILLDNVIIKQ